MIPSDGSPRAASSAQPAASVQRRAAEPEVAPPRTAPSGASSRTDRDHLVRMVAACLTAGVLTVAEVSGRSEDEVCALIAERTPRLDVLGRRRPSRSPRPPDNPDLGPDETLCAS